MKFDATFGVEIECYCPEGSSAYEVAAAIAARGIPCATESYSHLTRDHWKIVTDGSLGDMRRGIEIVSPVLHGEAALETVRAVMGALDDYGCTVSRKCGLHVHVGAAGQPFAFFRDLFKLYAHFEPVVDRFMPASRRASTNGYCRSIAIVPTARVDRAANLDQLISLTSGGDRYQKLNLVAFRRHQTVEFRQHSGTLDGTKAAHWISLCLLMVDAAKSGRTITGTVATPVTNNTARRGTKTYEVGQMMLRPEGVTAAEAMAATGLGPRINLRHYARACGLAATTSRIAGETRYFAASSAAVVSTTTPATLDGMCDLIGADETDRAYFAARTRNLSGSVAWAA